MCVAWRFLFPPSWIRNTSSHLITRNISSHSSMSDPTANTPTPILLMKILGSFPHSVNCTLCWLALTITSVRVVNNRNAPDVFTRETAAAVVVVFICKSANINMFFVCSYLQSIRTVYQSKWQVVKSVLFFIIISSYTIL